MVSAISNTDRAEDIFCLCLRNLTILRENFSAAIFDYASHFLGLHFFLYKTATLEATIKTISRDNGMISGTVGEGVGVGEGVEVGVAVGLELGDGEGVCVGVNEGDAVGEGTDENVNRSLIGLAVASYLPRFPNPKMLSTVAKRE